MNNVIETWDRHISGCVENTVQGTDSGKAPECTMQVATFLFKFMG